MKGDRIKKRRRDGEAVPADSALKAADKIPQAVGFDVLRTRINAEVTSNAVEMVRNMIDHAKEGQYQALKYLFEMIGLYPATREEETRREDSLEQFLLKRLGIPEEPGTANRAGWTPMGAGQDAVE